MSKFVYFDNAATTQIRKEVLDVINDVLSNNYGNPSSIYKIAQESKSAIVESSRRNVANLLGALPEEIYFTASGTEADNWAIKGIAEAYKDKGKHIITTCFEHHAVLHTCEYLEKNGYDVTYLPVNKEGLISLDDLKSAIRNDTILITIMFANNEIGTIQPIKEIGAIAKEKGIIFHTDAVQAVGHEHINVKELNIDLLSLSAHKIYGPKGIGALYIRKGVKIRPLIHGGAQERGRRAGTENVAYIAGLGKACELIANEIDEDNKYIKSLVTALTDGILSSVPYSRVNGSLTNRLTGNINISFDFIEGESILLMLDMNNICASSGSACTSGSLDPSHVLLAIGLSHENAHGSLRLSLGKYNTMDDVNYFLEIIPGIIQKLRAMSPLYEEFINKTK